jgi:hypothetical protein
MLSRVSIQNYDATLARSGQWVSEKDPVSFSDQTFASPETLGQAAYTQYLRDELRWRWFDRDER